MGKILAADIGGTSSRFAFYTLSAEGILKLEGSEWLKTGEAGSFSGLIDNLRQSPFPLAPEEADLRVFEFLVQLNQDLHERIELYHREDGDPFTPEQTLAARLDGFGLPQRGKHPRRRGRYDDGGL